MKRILILLSLAVVTVSAQSIKIDRFESTIKGFEEKEKSNPSPKKQIVLYGSSSFALWAKYAEHLSPLTVINRGFGGSTAPEAIYYFDRVIVPLKPKTILFYEGDNDMAGAGLTVDSTFANFRIMAALVKKKLPGTKLVYLSVKICPSRKHLIAKQKELNAMVKGFSYSDPLLGYIDITSFQFLPDGRFDPEAFKSDSVHVTDLAYVKWAEKIKHYLK